MGLLHPAGTHHDRVRVAGGAILDDRRGGLKARARSEADMTPILFLDFDGGPHAGSGEGSRWMCRVPDLETALAGHALDHASREFPGRPSLPHTR